MGRGQRETLSLDETWRGPVRSNTRAHTHLREPKEGTLHLAMRLIVALGVLLLLLAIPGCGEAVQTGLAQQSGGASPAVPVSPLRGSLSTCTTAEAYDAANPRHVPMRSPQAWALSTSAILAYVNGAQPDLVGMAPATPETISDMKRLLSTSWGVNNRADLLSALQWIDDGGHRQDWDRLLKAVGGLTESQMSAVMDKVAGDPEATRQIELVRQYGTVFDRKSLLGWDYSRYVLLCRFGYHCGYLSEAEAWNRIMPVARMLQKTFSSWADLGENFLVGREFWSSAETLRTGAEVEAAYQTLLDDPFSPWKWNLWDEDLGATGNTSNS
jgi:hypothetical protein